MLHNIHGCYYVKFGYWFINSLVRREEIREAEARPSLNELKVKVWKIPTAPKIKTFIWRAVSNAIPVGELLVKRGIKMDPVACGFQGESTTISYFNALLQDKYGRWTMYRIQKVGLIRYPITVTFIC